MTPSRQTNPGHFARLLGIGGFFLTILGLIVWRMVDLTVKDRPFLKGQGDARSVRVQTIPAYRGMITDRMSAPLAVSTPVQSVFINPREFETNPSQLKKLASLAGIAEKDLKKRIEAAKGREFLYIKRQIPPEQAQKIALLSIKGLNFQKEYKRFYPQSESTAQLIGFTNIDDVGIEGLELAYHSWLLGKPGKKSVVKDRTGRIVEELGMIAKPRSGHDLVLSIDRRIQYFAWQELKKTVEKFAALSGSVVVLDSTTGEILVTANYPSFNPNARGRYTKNSYRNKAITDAFEPGSVIKPFSIASALATGLFKPTTMIDTTTKMTVNGHLISDGHNYGLLNVRGVLEKSSNIGVSKMVLQSPPEQLLHLLQSSGFGQRTESNYPGESDGSIVSAKEATPFVLATVSFGYGLSVTALQLAKAYLIFANHGKLMPVTLLHGLSLDKAEQVLDAKTADQVLEMMESVLIDGTGKAARVPGYRVAGKTGTARIAGKKGYEEHRHIASFVGIAPVSSPRLVVVVVIHEPRKNGYYGAAVAAPLFAEVMSYALRALDISPDQPIEEASNET